MRGQVRQLLIRLKVLPFELGRVVNDTGNCLFDSSVAQLERPEMRIGLAQRAEGIETPQGFKFTILYTVKVIFYLNLEFAFLVPGFA